MVGKILSPHYAGIPSSSSTTKIAPENIASMQGSPITVSSWPRESMLPQQPHLIKGPHGKDYAVSRTANNIYATTLGDYLKNGHFSQIDDVNGFNPHSFERWKSAGEDVNPVMFDYVGLPKETGLSGVIEGFGERQTKFYSGDTPVKKHVHDFYVVNLPNNDVGKTVSQLENLRQSLMRYYKTRDAQELSSFLKSAGLKPEDIGYLAIGLLPKEAIYAVSRTVDGKVILLSAKDAYNRIVKQAKAYGIKPEEFRFDALHEEHAHIWRKSYDKEGTLGGLIAEEIATKKTVKNFYLKMAEDAGGNPELVRHYLKMAAIMEWDIKTTPKRYSKISSPKKGSLEAIIEDGNRAMSDTGEDGDATEAYESRKVNGKVSKYSKADKKESYIKSAKEAPREAETAEAPAETTSEAA